MTPLTLKSIATVTLLFVLSQATPWTLFEAGDFVGAARGFEKLLEESPDSPTLRFDLGLANYYAGDFPAAANCFEAVLKSVSSHRSAHFMLGVLAKSAGRFDEATRHFEAVMSLDSDDPATYYQLGQVQILVGDLAKSIGYFQESLRRDPENGATIYNLARAMIRAGKQDEGRRLMSEFQRIRKRDEQPMVMGTMGETQMIQGKYARLLPPEGTP